MYEKIASLIRRAPSTMLPALYTIMVGRCVQEDIFIKGAMQKIISSMEDFSSINKPVKSVLVNLTCTLCYSKFSLPDSYIHRKCGLNGCMGALHKLG